MSLTSPPDLTKGSLTPSEKDFHHSDLVINKGARREKDTAVRRSQSLNDPTLRFKTASAGSLGYHPLDLAIAGAPPFSSRPLSAGLCCICEKIVHGELHFPILSVLTLQELNVIS